jgi:thiol-disulfide isomerase/thioredoxin
VKQDRPCRTHHTTPPAPLGENRGRAGRSDLPARTREYNRRVAALGPGATFPRLTLREDNGDAASIPSGETLYAIFKTTCPTCELTLPYLDRIRQAGDGGMTVVAVSQDDPARTEAFRERIGAGFRIVYDPEPWPASDRLGVTSVPTLFLVGGDGRIRDTLVGFQKDRMQALAARGARLGGHASVEIFEESDREVPAFKAG